MRNQKQFETSVEYLRGVRQKWLRSQTKAPSQNKKEKFERAQYKGALTTWVFDRLKVSPEEFLQSMWNFHSAENNFRWRRQRNINYMRGRQLDELVYDNECKKWVPEMQYLSRRGIPPLIYNFVSRLVRNLTGQFRQANTGTVVLPNSSEEDDARYANLLSTALKKVRSMNDAKNKDAAAAKEAFLSGQSALKVHYGSQNHKDRDDVYYRVLPRSSIFMNSGITDYDWAGLTLIGEIHDTDLQSIISDFSNGDYDRGIEIEQAYEAYSGQTIKDGSYNQQSWTGRQKNINDDFFNSQVGSGTYRFYEAWVKIGDWEATTFDPTGDGGQGTYTTHMLRNPIEVEKEIEEINATRRANAELIEWTDNIYITVEKKFVHRWYIIYMTPFYTVLDVEISPYEGIDHPYIVTPPDINGEVWGVVEDCINSQRGMNRTIMMSDKIIAESAKGAWLVPESAIPDGDTMESYADKLKSADGMILYRVKQGQENNIPQQVFSNSSSVSSNIDAMTQLYRSLFDETSGNFGASIGRAPTAGTPASRYMQEGLNAGTNILDDIESILNVIRDKDKKLLALMIQFYDKGRYKQLTGEEITKEELQGVAMEVIVAEGINSPTHRLAMEEQVRELVVGGFIPVDSYLDVSSNPLMNEIGQKMKEMQQQQQQMAMGMTPGGGAVPGEEPATEEEAPAPGATPPSL